MRPESLDFFKAIVNVPSPSGYEQHAAELYRQYTKPLADEVHTDVHGNVYAVLNPEAEMKIMLAGHMDEIGFLIHYISDEGFLYFKPVGGHDSSIPVGQAVWVHGQQKTAGVIGRKAIHLLDDDERKKKPELKDLWIDIGASTRAEAEAVVSLGDPVTYQNEFQMLLGDRASARGFDNKMGSFIVAEAVRLLKTDGGLQPGVGVYGVATVQEEIGLRGARTSAYFTNAQTGLAVDVNHAIDYPNMSKTRHGQLDVGKGPSVARGANINPVTFKLIQEAAAENSIPYQVDVAPAGTGTDANAMQISRAGMATGLLGVALRYMHTPVELLSLTDVENCAKLMAAYCRKVSGHDRLHASPLNEMAERSEILSAFKEELRSLAWPNEDLELLPEVTRRSTPGGALVCAFALSGENADAVIQRELERFSEVELEWKLFSFDEPADLGAKLQNHGFQIGAKEVVAVYDLTNELQTGAQDSQILVTEVSDPESLLAYRKLAETIFGKDYSFTTAELTAAIEQGDRTHRAFLGWIGEEPAAIGRLYTHPKSQFAGLYGGGVLPEFRGLGLYRAVVKARAEEAVIAGARYVFVDALPTSLPILERLGFFPLAETWACSPA